ncbi:hypothetical protein MMC25_005356 [Agyrium rufum]|nr:hypothetical protein [Agyrium rufum]
MASPPKRGLLDLEAELTCSICTEVLYQPLTLLNCLHTFCGSCCKEWFASQAARSSARNPPKYTCPSCRAPVVDARPDAKVTTLLDMFVAANPGTVKLEQEKADIAKGYKPGDNVLPKPEARGDMDGEDFEEDDRRMIEEIRELSLRELEGRGPRSHGRGIRQHHGPHGEARSGRRRHGDQVRPQTPSTGTATPPREHDALNRNDSRSQARRIEHQSSLRSLLSNSDVDSAEMEEEILRQIMDEGLLEGIDLDNMNVSQEDALSERIAEAYRRRHAHATPISQPSASRRPTSSSNSRQADRSPRRQHAMSTSGTERSAHPAIRQGDLLQAYPLGDRRTSSEGRRQTSPATRSTPQAHPAVLSATDLSQRPQTTSTQASRPTEQPRQRSRTTESQLPAQNDQQQRARGSSQSINLRVESSPARSQLIPRATPVNSSAPPVSRAIERITGSTQASENPPSERRPSSSSGRIRPLPGLFSEPSITCRQCGKANLEYELHENCSGCNEGNYNLCNRCYLEGRGCLYWYGFGHAAWARFQQHGSMQQQLPHRLVGHRYTRPRPEELSDVMDANNRLMVSTDPKSRLLSGAFCSMCAQYTNQCYWTCDRCNEGEWGFCNSCVNKGKCCTHSLLPIAHNSTIDSAEARTQQGPSNPYHAFSPVSSPNLIQSFQATDLTNLSQFRPLNFKTNCDICKYPIQPSQTRFHCYECNDGDYDICINCYPKLVSKGLISRSNGPNGWRRCQAGHRMVVVGFEDTPSGQRRKITHDLVGGHFLKDDPSDPSINGMEWSWPEGQGTRQKKLLHKQDSDSLHSGSDPAVAPMLQKYPPDGGRGMRVEAIWSRWPQDDAIDELAFPKGAELWEMEDVNGDWFLGRYAGSKGLVPAGYFRFLCTLG